MSEMKSLARDTAIYGVSSIVGKFLNYLLVPLYTYVLKQTADYGIVTNLYAWTALLLVLLTYDELKNPLILGLGEFDGIISAISFSVDWEWLLLINFLFF